MRFGIGAVGLLSFLVLASCQEQIRFGVEQTVSTIPDILTDDVVNNLINIQSDRYAPIAQVSLKESVSTAINGFSYGAYPGIAFRAIAVTGLSAAANNSLNENWSADPANGSLDYYRLQLLLSYAIRGNINTQTDFGPVRHLIINAGYFKSKDQRQQVVDSFAFLPNLPRGPFAVYDGVCKGKDAEYPGTFHIHWICFHHTPDLTGEEVAHLLVLWTIAIPDMSSSINQPGASTKGSSSLTVSTPNR